MLIVNIKLTEPLKNFKPSAHAKKGVKTLGEIVHLKKGLYHGF
jgi:ribosome-binding protein aMBF1 (putative translation factor)